MLGSLIVGFGKAGRALHLPSLMQARRLAKGEGLFATSRPVAVDPRLSIKPRLREDQSLLMARALDQVTDLDPAATVAHVCTPPGTRVETLEALSEHGYTRIICEKPVADSIEALHEILDLADEHGLDIAVASPWLSSALTFRLRDLVATEALGPLRSLHFVQDKTRFRRTRDNVDHPSAFEIEIPHSVGAAMHLGGAPAEVVEASASDMEFEGLSFPSLGGAALRLSHPQGPWTTIESSLVAPVRRRSVTVRCEAGVARGWYSVGGDDPYAQLVVEADGEPPTAPEILPDEHLTRMIVDWYAYFAGAGPKPVSDLQFNVGVMDAVCEAKGLAGVAEPELIFAAPPAGVATA